MNPISDEINMDFKTGLRTKETGDPAQGVEDKKRKNFKVGGKNFTTNLTLFKKLQLFIEMGFGTPR